VRSGTIKNANLSFRKQLKND